MGKREKDIYCPLCKKFLVRTSINIYTIHEIRCSSCNKIIHYDPEKYGNDFKIKDVPELIHAGGKRFY